MTFDNVSDKIYVVYARGDELASTITIRRLQELDGLLVKASSTIRQHLNTATPINRCPAEILSEVFVLSAAAQLP